MFQIDLFAQGLAEQFAATQRRWLRIHIFTGKICKKIPLYYLKSCNLKQVILNKNIREGWPGEVFQDGLLIQPFTYRAVVPFNIGVLLGTDEHINFAILKQKLFAPERIFC